MLKSQIKPGTEYAFREQRPRHAFPKPLGGATDHGTLSRRLKNFVQGNYDGPTEPAHPPKSVPTHNTHHQWMVLSSLAPRELLQFPYNAPMSPAIRHRNQTNSDSV